MGLGADIFIGSLLPTSTLRAATARAFSVPIDRVVYREIGESPWPDADVVLDYFDETIPGDYPLQLLPWVPDYRLETIGTALAVMAHDLGAPILTSADSDDPMDMELYLPDGTMHIVSVDQDEDGGIRNSPVMRALIDRATPSVVIAS